MGDFHVIPLTAEFSIEEVVDRKSYSPALLDTVHDLWQAERRLRGEALFDGKLFSLVGGDAGHQLEERGALTGCFTEYRFFLAQYNRWASYETLQIRPLAVTGIVRVEGGVLLGRRADTVTQDPSQWELMPAGGLTSQARMAPNKVDAIAQVMEELEEEANIPRSAIQTATPRALLVDRVSHLHEIVIEISLRIEAAETLHYLQLRTSHEYSECQLVEEAALPDFALANPVSSSTRALIQALAWKVDGINQ